MSINELLKEKNMTKYRLSKISGVPFTNISEISTGKSNIKNCTGETLYKLAKALGVTMEELLSGSMEKRPDFEWFKSEVCHKLKREGDLDFIINTLQSDEIRKLYEKKWLLESLYLLAMVDYLSRENDLPPCSEYDDIRALRMEKIIYPAGVIIRCAASGSERYKKQSIKAAIPEFMRHNIMEAEVRNVV
ncbi:MAG: helix-turn-helix transcriptional regulator [Oscillospiraceae bacterium]|nr:helix-turn-helix transcriptional regulator [Oscillospiraceae bacterium]